ncbi:hypothetical protein CC2G_013875 [Coprinopsis cinerea AmutBmut pab1-1]|nr:hypothetical protein CC2G_013875 [Coprinopsis cinerea AmutBmut pab1-1]
MATTLRIANESRSVAPACQRLLRMETEPREAKRSQSVQHYTIHYTLLSRGAYHGDWEDGSPVQSAILGF